MMQPMQTTAGTYADLDRLVSLMTGDEKHAAAAESTLDVIWVLYDRVLRVSAQHPDDPDRDRFVLSKGHGPMAFYAVLAAKRFIPESALPTYGQFESILGHHPDRNLIRGVEVASGSLGHGLGLAVGIALGLRAQGRANGRVFALIGDGELDEGSNSEAIEYAGNTHLASLRVVAVDNRSSTHGWPGGIGRRFEVAGWKVSEVDGRDHAALEAALGAPADNRPQAVVAAIVS
jgi:transketolase